MKMLSALALLALSACAATPHPVIYPSRADVIAVTEAKPKPGADILTDPAANDRYNSTIEGWGDRVSSAGGRLCRYFKAQGLDVSCPGPASSAAAP